MNSELETAVMKIIASSGESKSLAFQALNAAKKRDFKEAESLLEKSKDKSTKTHNSQTELLTLDANDSGVDISLLLIHAQDHFMTSLLAIELIEEIVLLRKEANEGEL